MSVLEPFRPDAEGHLPIPDESGLGVELNSEARKKYGP
jgi:L-alanine-DL-glutamate epimerase-like enolase superfamily enzyme